MFKIDNNQKIGKYLESIIKQKYPKVRQFCIAYLKKIGDIDPSDEDISKMQNKMSQIIKGNKSIQTYDLPVFCDLLGVSCEQILSAGKCYVPISGHITNYEIAFSKNQKEWEEYIERDDKLFLNPDEYNKTVIDYAIEFKNYKFLKFLMDKKYIWFVDESKNDCTDRLFGFGAGTSIKRREIGYQDTLNTKLQYNSEEQGLRQKVIALAMENNDFDTLTDLRAREVPALYQLCSYCNAQIKCKNYYNEAVIEEIAKSDDKVLDYFSKDFTITDQFGQEHQMIYPYMSQLLERLIKYRSKYAEVLLRRSIEHNQKIHEQLSQIIAEDFETAKSYLNNDSYKVPAENIIAQTMNYFQFDSDDGFLSYISAFPRKDNKRFRANIVCVNIKSNDLLISSLIEQLNKSYDSVKNIQPDISNY